MTQPDAKDRRSVADEVAHEVAGILATVPAIAADVRHALTVADPVPVLDVMAERLEELVARLKAPQGDADA